MRLDHEWRQCIHPDDAPGVIAALQPYMAGKPDSATLEFRMLRKHGLWQWMLGRGMVVQRNTKGQPLSRSRHISQEQAVHVELNWL